MCSCKWVKYKFIDTMVYVPVKIGKVTFMAELYVLEAKHIPMIIGCDLLKNHRAKIDFEYKHVVINSQCAKPETRALLGGVINSSNITDNSVKLNPRVEKYILQTQIRMKNKSNN